MGKVLPEYLSNWTTEKVRTGERVITIYLSNTVKILYLFLSQKATDFPF